MTSYQNTPYGAVPQGDADTSVVVEHQSSGFLKKFGIASAGLLVVAVAAFHPFFSSSSSSSLPEAQSVNVLGSAKKELKDWQTPLFYTDQFVDHFSEDTGVWPNRYYVGEEHWKGPGSPLIVIMGGEGEVPEVLYPYVMDILAPKLGAYVLQTEHRFYGESVPTKAGTSALPTPDEFRRLFRPDQAIEDFVRITRHIQGKIGCSIDRTDPNYCPVITVGASYPGFLSVSIYFGMDFECKIKPRLTKSSHTSAVLPYTGNDAICSPRGS